MSYHTLWKYQPTTDSPIGKHSKYSPYKNTNKDSITLIDKEDIAEVIKASMQTFEDLAPEVGLEILMMPVENGKEYRLEFADWFSFVRQAEIGKSDIPDNLRSSRDKSHDSWAGGSFDESLRLAKMGWSEGAKAINAKLDIIRTHIPAKRMLTEMDNREVGPGTVDLNRYKEGHPQPYVIWKQIEDILAEGEKIVRIIYNGASSSGVSTDAIFTKGAMTIALIDLLERSGKRVELVIADRSNGHSYGEQRDMSTYTYVKRANDIMDIDRLAFAMCHGGCFRRLGFSIFEQMPANVRRSCGVPSGGYGRPTDIVEEGSIIIKASSLYDNSFSEQHQIDWIKEQLKLQGIEIDIEEGSK